MNFYDELKQNVVARFAAGIPPTSMQWLTGEDARHIYELDLLEPISKVLANSEQHPEGYLDNFYEFAVDYNSIGGELSIMPFSMHNEDMVWFNGAIYDELELEVPVTWDQFFTQAPLIEAAGYTAFSTTEKPSMLFMVFHAIVGGTAGREVYHRLFLQADPDIGPQSGNVSRFQYHNDSYPKSPQWNEVG